MSKHNRDRKQNRTKDQNPPSSPSSPERESGPAVARRIMNNMPLPTSVTLIPNTRACPGDPPPLPPPTEDGENATSQPPRESRANSVKRALRSKLLFPLEMLESINKIAADIAIQLKASTSLENWLTIELARTRVQCDEIWDQLQINKVRVVERVGTSWDDDCAERSDRTAARLHEAPSRVQRALARTKHGALILIDKWTLFGDAIDSERGIDEPLRQTAYDLLGIDHVFRYGSNQVPAATDVAGLRALVTREVERHRLNLERSLNARSESERDMAQMGLARFRDTITNSLRGDLNRARKRFSWAMETFRALKNGADPATLIDPETGAPVKVGPPLAAVPDPARTAAPAPPPPPPPPQPQAAPQPENPSAAASVPPLLAGCSDEAKAMYWVAAGTILNQSATPACDEPGPPPPTV